MFRRQDNTYFYRCQEKLVGQVANPLRLSKNYRLGTRSLNALPLLNLAQKHPKKEAILLNKGSEQTLRQDFQQFIITHLLLMCKSAEFVKIPLEQEHVPKEGGACNQSLLGHFQTKSVLHFTFLPESAELVKKFFTKLDTYAKEYDLEESKDFLSYPITHDHKHKTALKLGGICPCDPIQARNQYLNNWALNYENNSDQWRRTPM